MKPLAYSLNRWHGVADDTTVAITVTITNVTTATTPNRAAHCCGVSDDSASGS